MSVLFACLIATSARSLGRDSRPPKVCSRTLMKLTSSVPTSIPWIEAERAHAFSAQAVRQGECPRRHFANGGTNFRYGGGRAGQTGPQMLFSAQTLAHHGLQYFVCRENRRTTNVARGCSSRSRAEREEGLEILVQERKTERACRGSRKRESQTSTSHTHPAMALADSDSSDVDVSSIAECL